MGMSNKRKKGFFMVKVSVIIPVYNDEKYIVQCLESVLDQTLKDIEIICVDDGSADSSYDILCKYSREDSRIKVYHQENKGAGEARNLGINKSQGRFLIFLDSDDFWIDKNGIEKMYSICDKYGLKACGSKSKKLENGKVSDEYFYRIEPSDEIYSYLDFQMDYGYCSFLFSKEVLVNNGVFFPLYRRYQDPPFFAKALFYAEQFMIADTDLCCYRKSNIILKMNNKKIKHLLLGLLDNLEFAEKHNLELLFDKTLQRLEYEYGHIILHGVSLENMEVLELLIKVNTIVKKHYNDDYIINPLRKILTIIDNENNNYEGHIQNLILKNDKIVIYGAGNYAKAFINYLRNLNILEKVGFIIVSSKRNNEKKLDNLDIVEINDLPDDYDRKNLILVATSGGFYREIEKNLLEKGLSNFELLDDVFLGKLAGGLS